MSNFKDAKGFHLKNVFKFQSKPVARAVVTLTAALAAASTVQAGPGFGDAYDLNNNPFVIQSFFANSPSGARLWVDRQGNSAPKTGAPGAYDPANQDAYAARVGEMFPGGYAGTGKALRKFVDALPLPAGHPLAAAQVGYDTTAKATKLADGTDKYIPVAVSKKWVNPAGLTTGDDYYEIAVIEYAEKMHSDLKKATTLRGYVQIDQEASNGRAALPGSKSIALSFPDGTPIQIAGTDATGKLTGTMVDAKAVDNPHYLGPVIAATKSIPTRVKFLNLLPHGRAETATRTVDEYVRQADGSFAWVPNTWTTVTKRNGDIFLPLDPSVPGSGLGPDGMHTYTQNRANIHLHGGDTPWISDGGPHTWITPANEADAGKPGSVASLNAEPAAGPLDPALVPEFLRGPGALNVPDMNDPGPGAMTYYFPNGQSARVLWYHDHSVGMTRLNVMAGMAAPYLLTDDIEQGMITRGELPGPEATIPLVLQEKTFVPDDIKLQDGRWDTAAWGAPGDMWFPHVYETVQDPNQATNFNSVGRWHWGPWFWPSFPSAYNLPSGNYGDVTLTPEAWMDTPLVNGVAYPTLTVEPKPYRFRILNASNDRTMTFNIFVADDKVTAPVLDDNGDPVYKTDANGVVQLDPNTGNPIPLTRLNTEVRMVPVSTWPTLCAAGVSKSTVDPATGEATCVPDIWTTDVYGHNGGVPDPATQGPTIFQIASEGGLLPGVAIKDATPISYLLDKGRAAVLNTDFGTSGLHIGNAERADVVIDFSKYAGKTLIVYNDAGAPVPAADPRNEYFTGYGDNSATGGAEDTRPGYGPNTRTMMQIVVSASGTPGIAPIETADPAVQRTDPMFTKLDLAVKTAYALAQETPVVAQAAYNAAFNTKDPGRAQWNDSKAFANIYTGSLKEPAFNFVPGTPSAAFNSLLVQSFGSGYTRMPSVTLTGGGGTGATANATLKIEQIYIIDAGSGFKMAPVVTISANGQGSGVGATTTLAVDTVTVTKGGTGYTNGDLVTFAAPSTPLKAGHVAATGTLVTGAGGAITGVTNINGGTGYGTMPLTFKVATAGGTGASLSAFGKLASIDLDIPDPTHPNTAGGGGYTDLSTAASEPTNLTPGMNIRFTLPPGNGRSPTAGFTGKVFDVTVSNFGTGYTSFPTAAITSNEPAAGKIAKAAAIPVVAAIAKADTELNPLAPQGNFLVKTKAIQELFDPTYGRLNATFGVEIPFTSALTQTTIPLGYVDVPTEEFADGETQIWKITHNGVDSHPIHFHLLNVQLINRVGWDNFVSPPEPNELGWKETVKMSPLEDVIVAVRAVRPKTPGFSVPNSYRRLDPAQPEGAMTGFTQVDPYTGVPAAMSNVYNDFGWEYVWHCHILGHEENDFMRPIQFRAGDTLPDAPTAVAINGGAGNTLVTWTDPTPGYDATGAVLPTSFGNRKAEVGFRVERAAIDPLTGNAGAYSALGTVTAFPQSGFQPTVNTLANATSFTDTTPVVAGEDYAYRVVSVNTSGEAASAESRLVGALVAPSGLAVTADTASSISLSWTDNAHNEVAYLLGYSTGGGAVTTINLPSNSQTATVSGLAANTVYDFTIAAKDFNGVVVAAAAGVSGTTAPVAVTGLAGSSTVQGVVDLSWNNANPNLGTLTSVVIGGTVGGTAISPVTLSGAAIVGGGTAQLTGLAAGAAYTLTVTVNGAGGSAAANVSGMVAGANLLAATGATVQFVSQPVATSKFAVNWVDNSQGETGYQVQVCYGSTTQCTTASALSATAIAANVVGTQGTWYPVDPANLAYTAPVAATGGAASAVVTMRSQTGNGGYYYFRVVALNGTAKGPNSNITSPSRIGGGTVAAPTGVGAVSNSVGTALVSWTDVANNNSGYTVQTRRTGGVANVTLASGGSSYVTAPTVVISAPALGGVQASAHAVLTNGVVSIVVDNPGAGYTARPTVNVTGGNRNAGGTNASATGTANSTLGANTWLSGWANTTPVTVAGNVNRLTATGLLSGSAYQFQVRADGVSGGVAASGFVTTGTGVTVAK
jgi:FtsP/CotA-like multicopper oxidase with cupredoxin domain